MAPARLGGQIRHIQVSPVRPAVTGDYALPAEVTPLLSRRGIDDLYAHQAESLHAWAAGDDVLLATGTASGKSLVYNLAVGLRALQDPDATALFLFPLKALEQDQLGGLRADLQTLGLDPAPTAEIYDGDTSPYRRKRIREAPPTVLVSTPDMLHAGILPNHENWAGFLSRLRLIVLDEVHTYRGVLGSHVAQVLRRLLRVARAHGAEPQLIACSATIANPSEFLETLAGRRATVVTDDGSPRRAHSLVFVEPEASTYTAAARIFRLCVKRGLRTLAFTQARRITELMHTWIVEAEPELAARISSYRSGFLPAERRKIEARLFSGDLAGVISTSALELGIDVGGLDVCILVGYPGSILATRQRAGRVGREREGLVFLIPQQDALDRYFLSQPRELVERGCEPAVLDPANPEITSAHLACAAAEIPLRADEPWLAAPGLASALEEARRRGSVLESAAGGEFFAARQRPAREVSLRQIGESFTIRRTVAAGKGVIGTIGSSRVQAECHPGAIYLHRARAYLVRRLDLERKEVHVEGPVRVDHYTRAIAEKQTEILEVERTRPLGNALLRLGRLRITSQTTHYEKRRIFGQELLGKHELELPPRRFETQGIWLELAPEIETALASGGSHFMGAIHGLEHAALALFPLFALCDRFDVAGISIPRHPQVRGPAIFLYDGHPGGIGISRSVFPQLESLLEATGRVVTECDCEQGCPSCVHSPRCGSGNRPLDKRGTSRVVRLILGKEALPAPSEISEDPPMRAAEEEPAMPTPGPVIFDVETQRSAKDVGGWHNTHLMRLALAVVYDVQSQQFETYLEDRAEALVERLCAASLVIGFNIRRFDYGVLAAYTPRKLASLPTFDLLEDIHSRLGFRLSLAHLGEETLGRSKTADGLQSLEWFKQGRIDEIETYCRADVALVRDLLEFAEREGHVRFRSRSGECLRLPVDWKVEGPPQSRRASGTG